MNRRGGTTRHCILALLGMALTGLACGGSGSSGLTPGSSASCTVTVSGAVAGTTDCRPATTSSARALGFFEFEVAGSDPDAGIGLTVWAGVEFPSPPAVRIYADTDVGVLGGVEVDGADGAIWITGSYQLVFTSVSIAGTKADWTFYDGEGTLDATLVPIPYFTPSGAGAVTVHATF